MNTASIEASLKDFYHKAARLVKKNPRLSLAIGILWLFNTLVCLCLGGAAFSSMLTGALEARRAERVEATIVPGAELLPAAPAAEQVAEIPAPDCGQATLTVGGVEFAIQPVAAPADGGLPVPPDVPGVANWVEGTQSHPVFVLSPMGENLASAAALGPGEAISIVWADCVYEEYQVAAVESGPQGEAAFTSQSETGTAIYIQADPPESGYVIWGEHPKAQGDDLAGLGDIPQVESEITLVDVGTGLFSQDITVRFSILNTGAAPITLLAEYVWLTPEGGAPTPPLSVEPALPREIGSGSSEEFTVTFPRPESDTAIFRVFTVEFDLEDW